VCPGHQRDRRHDGGDGRHDRREGRNENKILDPSRREQGPPTLASTLGLGEPRVQQPMQGENPSVRCQDPSVRLNSGKSHRAGKKRVTSRKRARVGESGRQGADGAVALPTVGKDQAATSAS
jgi:hypothetical protein